MALSSPVDSRVRVIKDLFGPAAGGIDDEPFLTVDSLSVRFGGLHALRDVTLDVGWGELVAVIGPNGAGKTSLLNAISGLSRQHASGRIVLAGVELSERPPVQVARCGVARSFQDPPLVDGATVVDNLLGGVHHELGYRPDHQIWARRKVRLAERREAARALAGLSLVGLEDVADEPAAGLPYGTRKLIDIVRPLLARPRLLLLDEPTSGLDVSEQAVVRDLLLALRASGVVTTLVVEHHMDLVRDVATKVVGLIAGQVLRFGGVSEVLDSAEFRAAVVGR